MRKIFTLIIFTIALSGASCSASLDTIILNADRITGYTRTVNGVLNDLYDGGKIDAQALKNGGLVCKRIGLSMQRLYPIIVAAHAAQVLSAEHKAAIETEANSIKTGVDGLGEIDPTPQLATVLQPLAVATDNLVTAIARIEPAARVRLTQQQVAQVGEIKAQVDALVVEVNR